VKQRTLSYEQLKHQRYILLMFILALVVIVFSIFIELVQSQKSSRVDPKLIQLAKPLDPTLDGEIFEQLATYPYLSPEQVRSELQTLPILVIDQETQRIVPKGETSQAQPLEEETDVITADPDQLDETELSTTPPPAADIQTPAESEENTSTPDETPQQEEQ
jgi:hypothetical protein